MRLLESLICEGEPSEVFESSPKLMFFQSSEVHSCFFHSAHFPPFAFPLLAIELHLQQQVPTNDYRGLNLHV